jgi:hypothetical protein
VLEIVRRTGLARNTVRRFARARSPEELLGRDGTGKRPKATEPFEAYLRQRFAEGCCNAAQLWEEIRQRGYRGSYASIRELVRPWRDGLVPVALEPKPPTVRQVTAWIMSHPDHLDAEQSSGLKLAVSCHGLPSRSRAAEHIRSTHGPLSASDGTSRDESEQRAGPVPTPGPYRQPEQGYRVTRVPTRSSHHDRETLTSSPGAPTYRLPYKRPVTSARH